MTMNRLQFFLMQVLCSFIGFAAILLLFYRAYVNNVLFPETWYLYLWHLIQVWGVTDLLNEYVTVSDAENNHKAAVYDVAVYTSMKGCWVWHMQYIYRPTQHNQWFPYHQYLKYALLTFVGDCILLVQAIIGK